MIGQFDAETILGVVVLCLTVILIVERLINVKKNSNARDEVNYQTQRVLQHRANAEKDARAEMVQAFRIARDALNEPDRTRPSNSETGKTGQGTDGTGSQD